MNIRIIILYLSLVFVGYSCDIKDKSAQSENNIDAARNFIRSALDGKFNDARSYMLQDSLNNNYLDVAERSYKNADQAVKDGYKGSTIIIHTVNDVNDSTSFVIYSNSFKNDHDTLRVIKSDNQWVVDLKYLYEHDADTLLNKVITNDTVK
ncbi:MAG TPA: DUF4878 domain-containing protein [Chitinophagaceae bacterium]|nr:DUF4878 domain-containing protein [Chitinophagaceae bacterium]